MFQLLLRSAKNKWAPEVSDLSWQAALVQVVHSCCTVWLLYTAFKSCSCCPGSIFAQTTGLRHAHVSDTAKQLFVIVAPAGQQPSKYFLFSGECSAQSTERWLECRRALPWLHRSCCSFRGIFAISAWHCMVLCCTRVVRNTVFSIPFAVSLEKTEGEMSNPCAQLSL